MAVENSFTLWLYSLHGEVDKPLYADTTFPNMTVNRHNLVEFRELQLESDYIDAKISKNLAELQNFVSNLSNEMQCSINELGTHFYYFLYLYRLITLSYLYEAMVDYQIKLNKLAPDVSCLKQVKPLLLNGCSPKSSDLKDFISTSLMMNTFELSVEQQKISKNLNINQLLNNYKTNQSADITLERVRTYCMSIVGSCDNLTEQELKTFIQKSCEQDLDVFSLICNEKDHLMGQAHIPLAYQLITSSNILNVLGDRPMANACLRRFSQITRRQMVTYYQLEKLFSVIHYNLVSNKPKQHLQGSIFVYGALKEFKQKGLLDILTDNKIITQKIESASNQIKLQPKKDLKNFKSVTKKIEVVEAKKEIIQSTLDEVMEVPETEIPKSAFLEASEILDFSPQKLSWVDMVRFRFDFPFSFGQLKKYEQILASYSTIKALEEMKKFDKIGTVSKPIPLSFVKYLIDTKKHQGLFNMIKVLGDEFYVINDLDKNHGYKAQLIQPLNNRQTQFQWAILILENIR